MRAYCCLSVSYSTCATAIVIPRSPSSGALSIDPYSRTAIALFFVCSTFVIAAVNVVLPWSMCPIVPMFTCGFVRSYFAFAITDLRWPRQSSRGQWSPCPGLNRRPRPYQGRALPTELHGRGQSSWGPRNGPQTPDVRRPRQSRGLLDIAWSGKRDSNPRPPAWKAGALPLSYSRPCKGRLVRKWWGGEDLNLRPTAYKAVALPLSYASTDKTSH